MGADLLEIGSKLLAKVVAKEGHTAVDRDDTSSPFPPLVT